MSKHSNLTVKGQVTIPKDVRDALGLKPGDPVAFDWRGGSEAVIRRGRIDPEAVTLRRAAMFAAMDAASALHRTGRDPDDIMRELRGDEPLP